MFRVGDFSRIGQVSIKTLHHYDAIGLLKPAATDAGTGYRLYTIEQLARLHRIVALKELGFSLEQIAQLIDDDLSLEAIRAILHTKQEELQQRIAAEQERLRRVASRLRLIEQEGRMSHFEVVIRPIAALEILGVREVMPTVLSMG
jgi:DNA-binding transcriptional MerR regulator